MEALRQAESFLEQRIQQKSVRCEPYWQRDSYRKPEDLWNWGHGMEPQQEKAQHESDTKPVREERILQEKGVRKKEEEIVGFV